MKTEHTQKKFPEQKQTSHAPDRKRSHAHRKESGTRKKSASIRRELFDANKVPPESKKIIEHFDEIIADTRGLSGKQKVSLYGAIKNLSHQLTDDRNSRRVGYMNDASSISAYISYFMWWNLVRMTRLFANLPKSTFAPLENAENPVAIDVGSGTLTVVSALYLARPELRAKKIRWYCMDLSQSALSAGEDIYLSIAAKILKGEVSPSLQSQVAARSSTESSASSLRFVDLSATPSAGVQNSADRTPATPPHEPWEIIRVKGAFGTSIKEKADFITCGNVFNEILQRNEMPTDFLAKKYTGELLSYLKNEESAILLVEPGDPHSARFISLMRDALIRQNFMPVAPCPHAEECPMSGRTHGRTTNAYGKNAKWCNFAFDAESAPEKLKRLSEKAGLQKERASLSFIAAQKSAAAKANRSAKDAEAQDEKTFIRIASDFIRLPDIHKSGYYACSRFGMLLAIDESHVQPKNGELLQIKTPENLSERDKKSGGIIIKL